MSKSAAFTIIFGAVSTVVIVATSERNTVAPPQVDFTQVGSKAVGHGTGSVVGDAQTAYHQEPEDVADATESFTAGVSSDQTKAQATELAANTSSSEASAPRMLNEVADISGIASDAQELPSIDEQILTLATSGADIESTATDSPSFVDAAEIAKLVTDELLLAQRERISSDLRTDIEIAQTGLPSARTETQTDYQFPTLTVERSERVAVRENRQQNNKRQNSGFLLASGVPIDQMIVTDDGLVQVGKSDNALFVWHLN